MDQHIENNIRRIYSNHLDSTILDHFVNHLDGFFTTNRNVLLPVHIVSNYFSVFHVSHPTDIVLFAGTVDSNQQGQQFPILRLDLRNPNIHLANGFTFPYFKIHQQTNIVNVILCQETINSIPELLDSQLNWFTQQ